MEFEQLSIPDPGFDFSSSFSLPGLPPSVFYNQLDNSGKIYCKIDWLTVIFFNCSMNHVLRWLKLENCVSDFCANAYQQSRGYDDVFKFSYNHILIETSSFNFYGFDLSESIFDTVVPKIRLELSGSALDYLRSTGVDFNTYRLTVPELPEGGCYHYTRCDWAYDFINYQSEFVDRLISHINTHKLPSERIPLASTKGAISCKLVTCGQKTIYLGSPQSDRMLRIYDKRMQSIDLFTGVYKRDNPYNNPESWFRIEWQTRNKFANNLVLGIDDKGVPSDFKSILRDIFDRYAFADGTIDGRHSSRPVVDFWLALFDWSDLEKRIVQNASFVEFKEPIQRVVDTFFAIQSRSFALTYSYLGPEEFQKRMNSQIRTMFFQNDEINRRRRIAFLNKFNETGMDMPLDSPDVHGLYNLDGFPAFRL